LNAILQDIDRGFLDLVNENRAGIAKICRVYAWNRFWTFRPS
jgi:hypothetical protein